MAYKDKKEAIAHQNKWISQNYDRINLLIPKGQKEIIKAHAEKCGVSVNQLIWKLIEEKLNGALKM